MAGDPRVANYAGAFDGRLAGGSRPALLLIDAARAYVEPGSPLHGERFVAAVPVMARLLAAARAAGTPVIHTQVVYQPGGIDGGLFYRKVPALRVFDAGSPLGRFAEGLEPRAGEVVVTKQYASAFFGTSLAATLNAARIDSLVITGFSTSGCVRATGLDTLQHGLLPYVVSDGCADRHEAPHEANLFDLQSKYAEVIDSAAAEALLSGAGISA